MLQIIFLYVSSGTLNPTHSLTHLKLKDELVRLWDKGSKYGQEKPDEYKLFPVKFLPSVIIANQSLCCL